MHLSFAISLSLSLMLVLPVDADDIILFALLTPLSSMAYLAFRSLVLGPSQWTLS